MIKEFKNYNDIIKLPIVSNNGATSTTFLEDKSIIKLYNMFSILVEMQLGMNTEEKILSAQETVDLPEINFPQSAIYTADTKKFIASRYNFIEGQAIKHLHFGIDLEKYCDLHLKLEDFLKRADKHHIVLSDYASLDNIIIDKEGNIHFIDYEGMQIGKHKTATASRIIAELPVFHRPKYTTNDCYFTKEVNILSWYIGFFLNTLNLNLSDIGKKTVDGTKITLDSFFKTAGIDNPDIQHKIWKLLNPKQKNEYLGDDLLILKENYKLKTIKLDNGYQHKQFIQK